MRSKLLKCSILLRQTEAFENRYQPITVAFPDLRESCTEGGQVCNDPFFRTERQNWLSCSDIVSTLGREKDSLFHAGLNQNTYCSAGDPPQAFFVTHRADAMHKLLQSKHADQIRCFWVFRAHQGKKEFGWPGLMLLDECSHSMEKRPSRAASKLIGAQLSCMNKMQSLAWAGRKAPTDVRQNSTPMRNICQRQMIIAESRGTICDEIRIAKCFSHPVV